MISYRPLLVFFILLYAKAFLLSQEQAVELGKVHWLRSYDEAVRIAEEQGKDILILFQEVPGCATCRNYGTEVLSHPLIVEAIENEFVPLCIFNNHKGEDERILKKYNEPSWNNPVVRIVNTKGENIIQRVSGSYNEASLILNMVIALSHAGRKIPQYLKLLEAEYTVDVKDQKTAYFSMYCFWSGEAYFGDKQGVIHSYPGFMNGKEVVKLNYDASRLNINSLARSAAKEEFSLEKKVSKFRLDKDPQYYLKKSHYRFLALSQIQRSRINSAIHKGQDPSVYLSPTQLRVLDIIENDKIIKDLKVLYDKELNQSWMEMIRILN